MAAVSAPQSTYEPYGPKRSLVAQALYSAFGCSRHSEVGHGLSLERGLHAFGHRHRHKPVHVRDAFLRRPYDTLSHLRLGRGCT
jgi:hypothetical protein